MGITMTLRAATDEKIAELAANPDALDKYLNTISADKVEKLSSLFGSHPDPQVQEMVRGLQNRLPEPGEHVLDVELEKLWNGVHYLLTGQAGPTDGPMSILLPRGNGMVSRKVASAHPVNSDKLASFETALDMLDEDVLFARLDGKKMDLAGVYPEGYWSDGDNNFDELRVLFKKFKHFLKEAHARGEGMIVWAI